MSLGAVEQFRVIGIVLVRNEDFYVETSIKNIVDACDEIQVFDHRSTDRTTSILKALAAREPKVSVRTIRSPEESHQGIEKYAGTRTWIFAVDGDEIYDPVRTQEFCDELRGGKYSEVFQLRGNVLHVDEWSGSEYKGFLAPPSRAMNKLFNFSLLKSWEGGFERLHGGTPVYVDGIERPKRHAISDDFSFEDSPFRCLHMVFLRRSSKEKTGQGTRLNIADNVSARFGERLRRKLLGVLGIRSSSPGKLKNYRLGDRVTVIDPVFRVTQSKEL